MSTRMAASSCVAPDGWFDWRNNSCRFGSETSLNLYKDSHFDQWRSGAPFGKADRRLALDSPSNRQLSLVSPHHPGFGSDQES